MILFMLMLISNALIQLKIAVGNDVKIERPKYDYLDFRPRDPDLDFEGN